ncbi:MAG: Ig-like domain-containing protein, partial [Chloroflexi bacterium]|nr:Ig-like domain-containing protein [Chloroflexota bacterium]
MKLFCSRINIVVCATAVLVLGAQIATADAKILWGGAQPVAGDSDVATNGVLCYAEHWGGTDATVNGVPFTAAGVNVVPSIFPGINGNIGAPSGFSTEYQNILRGNWYNSAGRTLTLKNLVVGHAYQVQVWACDIRYSPSQTTAITGGPSLGIKAGHYAIGTFTADGTTQRIWSGGDGVVNAVMVRNISGITVGPVSAPNSTVIASPAAIPADGVTAATITVTLRDTNNLPVSGKTVTLTSSRGGADTISAASGPSSSAGVVALTVNSTNTGLAVFSAVDVTDSNLALTQTATVSVTTVGSRAQASPNPIVFDQTATNDNLVVLMAAASEHSDSLSLLYSGPSVYPKHFWFANFNSPSQFMKWNVSLATGAVYRVYAKLSAGAILPLQLSVT